MIPPANYFVFDYAFFQKITELESEVYIYQQLTYATISVSLGKTVAFLFKDENN